MKKQLLFMAFIALVAMTFTACSSDEAIADKGKALSLDASILHSASMEISTRGISISSDTIFAGVMHYKEVKMSTSEISRAPLDDTPTWVGNEAVTLKVDGRYFEYTIGGSGSSSTMMSASPYYFTTTSNVTANAWYPSSGAANKTIHEVLANQSTDANFKNSDFMYGSGTVAYNSAANSISMTHKIAKVRVTVSVVNPSYLNNSTVNGVTLCGTKRNGSVGSNGILTASGSASDITMHKKGDGVYEACIIPQTAELSFDVNIGGTTYTSTAVASRAYAANKIYTATIKITATKALYIGGSSVAIGDYYCMATNGQAFVVKKANLSTAKSKGLTPLGVVFANSTSTNDHNKGWSLGYVMCVKGTTDNNVWSKTEDKDEVIPNLKEYDNAYNYYDGYTDFTNIKQYAKISGGYTSVNYPAFYQAAAIMATPKTSSGFYLPSFGQFRKVCVNLGEASDTLISANENPTNIGGTTYSTYVSDIAKNAPEVANKINTYLSAVSEVWGTSAIVDVSINGNIWTSTECDSRGGWMFDFCSGCKRLHVYGYPKTGKKHIRPVLAF